MIAPGAQQFALCIEHIDNVTRTDIEAGLAKGGGQTSPEEIDIVYD